MRQAPALLQKLRKGPIENALKSRIGIAPDRRLPSLPSEHFFSWAKRKGLDRPADRSPKVAYFAGCTAGYFFPEIAIAAVGALERNGIAVHVPEQQCCGMPLLLEGDKVTALKRMRFNLNTLLARVPGLSIQRVGCGMGGSLGFKQGFSERSLALGDRLFAKIQKAAPDAIVTDCISCRLQFEHALPYPVFHPLQVLAMTTGQQPAKDS